METDVRVGCKVNEEEVDYELDNLDSGDPFLPPDTDTARRLEVVPVHDDVDCQVESNWDVALWVIAFQMENIRPRCDQSVV